MLFDQDFSISLFEMTLSDTADVGYPNKYSGIYSFQVAPGKYRLVYSGIGYLPQTIDTLINIDNAVTSLVINVKLEPDPDYSRPPEPVYEKLNLADIPVVSSIDSSILITNMTVSDINDANISDSDVLYYTVQVMALYNPVDVSYFKYINDMKVLFNEQDKFYRYTSGNFNNREDAVKYRLELIRKGYPDQIFIKKVSK